MTQEEGIPDGWEGLDIGPKTCELFRSVIIESNCILWNGYAWVSINLDNRPLGVFELEPFSGGTRAALDAVVYATRKNKAVSIAGGGDTATAVEKWGCSEILSHVSTGGGASLELLEGKVLPGVAALSFKS